MIRIGSYRQVYEANLQSFLDDGYDQEAAHNLAQAVAAQPLPESVLALDSERINRDLPQAELFLEDQYDETALKIAEAVYMQSELFRDPDDPMVSQLTVNGVYPGMAVVRNESTGIIYAADWTMGTSGAVTFSNVRAVTGYYNPLNRATVNNLGLAVEAIARTRMIPMEVESAMLVADVLERNVTIPKVTLDGARPVAEIEWMKYLRAGKVLTESLSSGIVLNEKVLMHRDMSGRYHPRHGRMFSGEAVPKLAMVRHRMAKAAKSIVAAKVKLENSLSGVPMFEFVGGRLRFKGGAG